MKWVRRIFKRGRTFTVRDSILLVNGRLATEAETAEMFAIMVHVEDTMERAFEDMNSAMQKLWESRRATTDKSS